LRVKHQLIKIKIPTVFEYFVLKINGSYQACQVAYVERSKEDIKSLDSNLISGNIDGGQLGSFESFFPIEFTLKAIADA